MYVSPPQGFTPEQELSIGLKKIRFNPPQGFSAENTADDEDYIISTTRNSVQNILNTQRTSVDFEVTT